MLPRHILAQSFFARHIYASAGALLAIFKDAYEVAQQRRECETEAGLMLGIIVQLAIVGLWASMLIIHTRRLLRMAQLEVLQVWDGNRLRRKLTRLWWWLGREEYWRAVQVDGLRCTQMTLMLFLMVWGGYAL
jgi:hypothetical protein